MQIMQQLVQNGGMGTLVTPQNIYNAVSEFIAQSGYKNPNQFVTRFCCNLGIDNYTMMKLVKLCDYLSE